jgi:hypothetical protein
MALPKKGIRKINVNGQDYSWIASGNDGFIYLIICSSSGHGQKLLTQFEYHSFKSPTDNCLKQQLVITPSIVKQVIEYGLKQGWTPEKRGGELSLGFLHNKINIKFC